MARTPLLRALQRLARDHQHAEALGISPQELREQEQERAYSRGEFLKRSGTAGAAVALAGRGELARRPLSRPLLAVPEETGCGPHPVDQLSERCAPFLAGRALLSARRDLLSEGRVLHWA